MSRWRGGEGGGKGAWPLCAWYVCAWVSSGGNVTQIFRVRLKTGGGGGAWVFAHVHTGEGTTLYEEITVQGGDGFPGGPSLFRAHLIYRVPQPLQTSHWYPPPYGADTAYTVL